MSKPQKIVISSLSLSKEEATNSYTQAANNSTTHTTTSVPPSFTNDINSNTTLLNKNIVQLGTTNAEFISNAELDFLKNELGIVIGATISITPDTDNKFTIVAKKDSSTLAALETIFKSGEVEFNIEESGIVLTQENVKKLIKIYQPTQAIDDKLTMKSTPSSTALSFPQKTETSVEVNTKDLTRFQEIVGQYDLKCTILPDVNGVSKIDFRFKDDAKTFVDGCLSQGFLVKTYNPATSLTSDNGGDKPNGYDKLNIANALGDDRNLLEHGQYNPNYWYSVSDGFRLVLWLRQQYLNYDGKQIAKVGGEYIALRENNNRVLLTDPYYGENFNNYLSDDIDRVIASKTFTGLAPWEQMPTTMIIPLLSALHWRAIKVTIDYSSKSANILFDDPYGLGAFQASVKITIISAIKVNVEKLIRIQTKDSTFDLADYKLTQHEKNIDQQGQGKNSWDCGPITFSNIEYYLRSSIGNNCQDYLIPSYTDGQHATKITETRSCDVLSYSKIVGVPIDQKRLTEIKQQLAITRQSQIQNIKGLELSLKINELDPFYISMLFEIIKNKRLFETQTGSEKYTNEELSYAYMVVLDEIRKESNPKKSSDKNVSSSEQKNSNAATAKNKEELKKEKLKNDLANLIRIKDLVTKIQLLNNDNQEKILDSLHKVGQLIHDISWDEENKECIRNKHGYRNRHKDEGNKLNKEGAKISFETLSHLKDLAKDKSYQKILITGFDLIKKSLQLLQQKINFILSKETAHHDYLKIPRHAEAVTASNKSKSDDSDLGFILKASAYFHDSRSIDKLISYLEQINMKENRSIDLTDKVHRYYLGYMFVQIGETAKEISDYIKPETPDTEFSTRSLFTKLGHYRQVIKDSPNIVSKINDSRLMQMKQKLEAALPDLMKILIALKGLLLQFKNDSDYNVNALDTDYHKLNLPEQKQTYSKFELSHTQIIKNVTKLLDEGTINWKKKVNSIDKEIDILKQSLKKAEVELAQLEEQQQKSSNSVTSYILLAKENIAKVLLESKQALQFKFLLKDYLAINSGLTSLKLAEFAPYLTSALENISNQVQASQDKSQQKTHRDQESKLRKLQSSFLEVQKKIKITTQKHHQSIQDLIKAGVNIEEFTLGDLLDFLTNNGKEANSISEIQSTKSSIDRHKKRIEEQEVELLKAKAELHTLIDTIKGSSSTSEESKQEEYQAIEYRINLLEEDKDPLTTNAYLQDSKQATGENIKSKEKSSNTLAILKKLTHEIETLKEIEQTNDISKLEYARKMSIGFIGQHLKELSKDPDFQSYLKDDALFFDSIRISINTRHKVVMHGTLISDADQLVMQTAQHHLLPWQQSYESLKIIMLNDQGCKNLILKLFPAVPAWNEESFAVEEEMLIKVLLIGSYSRLMKYTEAEKVFLDDKVQNYLNNEPNVSPALKLFLLVGYAHALFPKGDAEKTKTALEKCAGYLKKLAIEIPELYHCFTDIERDIYADLLLVDQDLKPDSILFSFTDPNHKLKLANNLLERLETKKALEIITPIIRAFESDPNNFINLAVPRCKIGLDCYKLMSMYHRTKQEQEQAIYYLNKVHNVLELNAKEFTEYWGGMTALRYANIHHLKSCCYNNWGKQIYHSDDNISNNAALRNIAVEKFNAGYTEGVKAVKKYGVVEHNQIFDLARTYASMACSKAYLSILNNNNSDLIFSKSLLDKAENLMNQLTNPTESMPICELWIELATIYVAIQDQPKQIYCLAQAESNKYWKHCANYMKVPLSQKTTVLGEYPHFTIQDLTWNELYKYTTNKEVEMLGGRNDQDTYA